METLFVFVVKRYAVRDAKKWRYAVRKAKIRRYAERKAKIGRYAERKGKGGVTLKLEPIYCTCTINGDHLLGRCPAYQNQLIF